MNFIKAAVICLLAAGLTYTAQDPANADRAAQAKERIAELQERLKLTPDQIEKLKPIVQQEAAELKAIRDKAANESSKRGKRQALRAVRDVQDKYEPQVEAILTKEQMAEWKKIREERKEAMKQKRGR